MFHTQSRTRMQNPAVIYFSEAKVRPKHKTFQSAERAFGIQFEWVIVYISTVCERVGDLLLAVNYRQKLSHILSHSSCSINFIVDFEIIQHKQNNQASACAHNTLDYCQLTSHLHASLSRSLAWASHHLASKKWLNFYWHHRALISSLDEYFPHSYNATKYTHTDIDRRRNIIEPANDVGGK